MSVAFTRQLGAEPGVQLNPIVDNSGGFVPDNSDQVFAIPMRAKRGRIDRCFKVDRSNVLRKLGSGDSIRASRLNEPLVMTHEALNKGAFEAVIHRLVKADETVLKYIVARTAPATRTNVIAAQASDNSFNITGGVSFLQLGFQVGQTVTASGWTGALANNSVGGRVITAVTNAKMTFGGADGDDIVDDAAGEFVSLIAIAGPGIGDVSYTTMTTLPQTPYLFALKHMECFNDGVIVDVHADAVKVGGVDQATKVFNIRVKDPVDNTVLFDFTGSTDPTALDDFSRSFYLTDVLASSSRVPDLEIVVSDNTTIAPATSAYGRDSNGRDKTASSGIKVYFTEGGTDYGDTEYETARERLQFTELDYAYISSGGSQAEPLLTNLAQLAFDTNRQLKFDVDGSLDPDAVITFLEDLNLDSHYCQAFWSPLQSDDPLNGGKAVIGTSAYNIARACLRNAATNSLGFAPKNFPIAGKSYPLDRTGIKQLYTPTEFELNDLAKAKVNPVLFERYNGGGLYVFTDSLTCAKTNGSLRKLAAVADMSSSLDEVVTRFGKEVLQLPMSVAVDRQSKFMQKLLEGAEAAGWIVKSDELGGRSFQFEVKPNALRPVDRMDVTYSVRYDGTTRQITVTQTLVR